MPTLTLEDVPPELHRRLEARALRNRRSLNREAIECLRAAMGAGPLDPEVLLARARALRQRVSGRLPQRPLESWKRAGRP
jgi:plasmid stability protein